MTVLKNLRSERIRRISNEGFWILVGQIMAVLGALVGVRLLTELLAPAVYGELALGMTVATLVNQIVLGPLGNGVTRFFAPAQEQEDLAGYFKAVRALSFWASGTILIISLFTVTCLALIGLQGWIPLATAAFFFALLSGYSSIFSGLQNAARQRSVVAFHRGVESWGRFLVAAGFIILLGGTSAVAMAGYVTTTIVVLCSQYWFFRKLVPDGPTAPNKDINWREKIWQFSWPFASWGVFTWIRFASDRWALGLFSTTQEVGFYAVLFQLGYYPISMVTGMASQFLAPIFYQMAGDATDIGRNADVNNLSLRITRATLALTGLSFILAYLFHSQIFAYLAAEEYAPVSHLLPWMILSGGIFATGQTMGLNLMSQMKPRVMLAATIITALLGAILNLAGAYWCGNAGVVFAGVIFSLFYFQWMLLLSKKETREMKF